MSSYAALTQLGVWMGNCSPTKMSYQLSLRLYYVDVCVQLVVLPSSGQKYNAEVMVDSVHLTPFFQYQPKQNCDRSAQKHKKPKDNKPKVHICPCF